MANTEYKASDMHLLDLPFICRICLRRGHLRLFEEVEYLLELFMTITKIDARSTVNFPSYICYECINELEDISLFIDISKCNDSRPGKNMILKKENECVAIVDFGLSQDPVVKTEKKTEEYEDDICTEKSEMCRICLVSSCLTPFDEKEPLMQLFQNITNIDLEATSTSSSRNSICNKCIDKLVSISLFISLSLSNDMIIESTMGRNEFLKTKNCLEENATDISSPEGNDMKFDNVSDRREVKVENYYNESVCSNESKDLHTVVDIKNEILYSPEAPIPQNDQQGLEFCSDANYAEKLECDPCGNEVSTENHPNIVSKGLNDGLKAHVRTGHFTCDCCKKSFTTKQILKNHMLTHTGGRPFKCDTCEKSFNRKHHLKMHMLTHSGEKPFKCDICERSFNQKQHLKTHMLTHNGEKPFKCDSCGKNFNLKNNLKTHMITHSGEKPLKCESCGKKFNKRDNLKMHMLTHNGEKSLRCDSCGKRFNYKHSLNAHMLTHTAEKSFTCDNCGKRFNYKQSLNAHMLSHTGEKPFECDICQKGFGHKGDLMKHMLIHTGEKPFKCDCCEKSFNQNENLKVHMLTHTGEKPFKCDSCGKNFNRKQSLKLHMLTHTGEKPFKCDSCGKNFNRKQRLKLHMHTHTGKNHSNMTSAKKVSARNII